MSNTTDVSALFFCSSVQPCQQVWRNPGSYATSNVALAIEVPGPTRQWCFFCSFLFQGKEGKKVEAVPGKAAVPHSDRFRRHFF